MKQIRLLIMAIFSMIVLTVSAAENYFRPGTVWTVEVDNDAIPADYIIYNTILDEVTFEGENVLPFAQYSDESPEPEILRYLRTDGDKVYWRSTNPDYPDWYLLYDFGLKECDEVVVYQRNTQIDPENKEKIIETVYPATLKCLRQNYYINDNPLKGPMMRLQLMSYKDNDEYEDDSQCQGNWIIGMGYSGGSGDILSPWEYGWVGGGTTTICVESPKGNIVYGQPPVTGIKVISNNELSESASGVFNFQGIRVADSAENLPTGLYIVNGKKVIVK